LQCGNIQHWFGDLGLSRPASVMLINPPSVPHSHQLHTHTHCDRIWICNTSSRMAHLNGIRSLHSNSCQSNTTIKLCVWMRLMFVLVVDVMLLHSDWWVRIWAWSVLMWQGRWGFV